MEDRWHTYISAFVCPWHVRVGRHAHQRPQRPGVRAAAQGRQYEEADRDRAAAVPADHQGPGRGPDRFLQEVRDDEAVAHQRVGASGEGTVPVAQGCGTLDGVDEVYYVRLLHDELPIALVERELSWPRGDPERLPVCVRYAGRSAGSAYVRARLAGRRVALPYDLQLRRSLPERDQYHVAYFASEEKVSECGIIKNGEPRAAQI